MVIPKGYKQTEVGVIPNDWEVSTLEKKYNLFAGGDLDVQDYSPQKTSQYRYCILSNSLQTKGVYGYCQNPKYKGNSLTITGRGDVGHSVYRAEPFSAIVRLLVCEPKSDIDSYFVATFLENTTPFFFETTGVPQLTVPQIKNTAIPIPTIDEQRRISSSLSDIDELISSLEKLIAKYEAIKKASLQNMFPRDGKTEPKMRLPGFTGAWEQRKVSEITNFHKQGFYTTESYDGNKKYYLLRGTDLTENKLILRDTPKIDATDKDYQAFKTQIGDFLIVRSGTVGTYGIVYEDISAIFGSYLIDFRFDNTQVTNEFFGYFYQSDLFKNQLRQIIQQSANTNINAENIKCTSIKLPLLPEQKKIGDFFGNLDHLITLHQRKLKKLKEVKHGMMQQLLTGKIRLV